jgi:hypothetical protein
MKAWQIIEQNGWCQKVNASSDKGRSCSPISDKAVSFCIFGAIDRKHTSKYGAVDAIGVYDDVNSVQDKLQATDQHALISVWNDHPERTKEEVIALLKELDI